MNPSKEECRKAIVRCRLVKDRLHSLDRIAEADAILVQLFLEAACRRLPTEQALEADRQRRRRRPATFLSSSPLAPRKAGDQ